MKKKEKIMIAILVAITAVVIIFAATRDKGGDVPVSTGNGDTVSQEENIIMPEEKYVEVAEDGTKVNTSEALASNKVVKDIEFSNIALSQKNGETMLVASIKNNGAAANDLFSVEVTLIDDQGQDIVTVGGLVAPLQPGATGQFETSMTLDYANAYDFRVVAVD